MADPGTIIAILTVSYACAIKAWSTFQNGLNYDDDSANLVLRLEIEKFRLQTWALNVGLTKGTFDVNLHPIHEVVAERLNRITKLVEEAEKVKESFGLVISEASKVRPEKMHSIMSGMASSIRSMGIRLDVEDKPKDVESKNIPHRIRWALTSKSKFSKLVSTLEEYIDKLDALLTESQRRAVKDDWKQINIVLVGCIPAEHVEAIQQGLRPNIVQAPSKSTSEIVHLIERKAIQAPKSIQFSAGARSLEKRDLSEFVVPADMATKNRVLAAPRQQLKLILGSGPFLLERKQYDANISIQDKRQLKSRLDRLILLLSSARSEDFRTFRAVGYCDDPDSFSWWLIFQCPFSIPSSELERCQIVSLRNVFSLKHKPALEERFMLASQISKSFAELLNSGWLHKNVRSENVLFPEVWEDEISGSKDRTPSISSSYLAGLEYSRQDTEAVTIDKGRHLRDIQSAIYRHPDYQGEAASGYKTKYDIYSVGLVFVEIALWMPILTFLDAKGGPSTGSVQLSSKMKTFHREEALELKRRILGRIDGELGFRVGSKFRDAVRWCLTMSENDSDEEWHPALGFYNHVVAPLERCTALFNE